MIDIEFGRGTTIPFHNYDQKGAEIINIELTTHNKSD
jgi:hypothetical protein